MILAVWIVCGPPRSATTLMLEAVAAYTPLTVRWDVRKEWGTRRETGLREHFYEGHAAPYADDDVVKVLWPFREMPLPVRAILMVRNPVDVSRSAAGTIHQRISPVAVADWQDHFRRRWGDRLDEVRFDEIDDLDAVFARLKLAGWPVVDPCWALATRAVR